MRTTKLYSTFFFLAILGLAASSAAAADTDGESIDDTVDQFPCDASLSTTVYVPSQSAFGSVLVEDNWPAIGDLDFNDAAVAYQYALGYEGAPANNNLRMLTLSFNVLAAGAGLPSGLALSLPIPKANIQSVTLQTAGDAPQSLAVRAADTNAVIDLVDNTKNNFQNVGPFVNTDPSIPAQTETKYKLTVSLSSAVQVNPAEAPFDLFFFHTDDPTHEIHRPMYEGTASMNQALFNTEADGSTGSRHFVDNDGLPFVLDIPKVPQWANEQVSIDLAYPQIVGFASSGGSQNQTWYDGPVPPHIFAVGTGGGTMPNASFIPGENGYLPGWADDSCFSCNDGVQNGYETGVDCGGSACASCYTYAWMTSAWGACSASCGGGTQSRSVFCQRSDGSTVADSFCEATRPSTSQSCNTQVCSDPLMTGVVLLLHFDEYNGSTTTHDVKGHTVTAHGGARISSSKRKFGNGAAYFDGNQSWFQTEDHLDFHMGGGQPYAIELWADGNGTIVNDDYYGHFLYRAANGDVQLLIAGVTPWTSPWPVIDTVGTGWHHYAITFDGSYYRAFVDGQKRFEGTGAFYQTHDRFTFGDRNGLLTHAFTGYIDEARVTKGAARYTQNFSVPTSAFPSQ